MNLKHKIEAILFSAGKRVEMEEISRLANTSTSMAQQVLNDLKEDYKKRESSLMLVDEGNAWKLIVKDEFIPVVKNIVTETELSKTMMETLAVIAFKYPIKQSDLIKIRTNKAYDHLRELDEMGYISRQKHGRSKLIKLTQRFFEYFDLPEEKLKDKFQDFDSIAKAIEDKESEIEKIKEEQLKKAQEEKEKDQKIKEEIKGMDADASTVENDQELTQEPKEKLGDLEVIDENDKQTQESSEDQEEKVILEVVDEPSDEELQKEHERLEKIKEEDRKRMEEKKAEEQKHEKKEIKANEKKEPEKEESEGIRLETEEEKKVEKRVDEIMNPEEEKEQ